MTILQTRPPAAPVSSCGWCRRTLDDTGQSLYFCDEVHQKLWMEQDDPRIGRPTPPAAPVPAVVEPVDVDEDPVEDTACDCCPRPGRARRLLQLLRIGVTVHWQNRCALWAGRRTGGTR